MTKRIIQRIGTGGIFLVLMLCLTPALLSDFTPDSRVTGSQGGSQQGGPPQSPPQGSSQQAGAPSVPGLPEIMPLPDMVPPITGITPSSPTPPAAHSAPPTATQGGSQQGGPPRSRVKYAIQALRTARREMVQADSDFHGHRERAIARIDEALHEAEICLSEP